MQGYTQNCMSVRLWALWRRHLRGGTIGEVRVPDRKGQDVIFDVLGSVRWKYLVLDSLAHQGQIPGVDNF